MVAISAGPAGSGKALPFLLSSPTSGNSRLTGRMDGLVHIHREKLEVAEAVAAVIAVTLEVKIEFRALRQPELHAPLLKLHGTILNRQMFYPKPNCRNFLGEVGLEPHHLEGVSGNPRA